MKQIVKSTDSLKKISFLAHSLGGLIARYAVAALYTCSNNNNNNNNKNSNNNNNTSSSYERPNGTIAGLEAINFITLATPHLGVRGNKQVFLFFSLWSKDIND